GASAAVISATIGATLIFLAARTALGDPLLGAPVRAQTSWPPDFARIFCAWCRCGLRRCAAGAVHCRDRDRYYPGSHRLRSCWGRAGQHDRGAEEFIRSMHRRGGPDCRLAFDPADVPTPQLIAALVALPLMPVVVKYWRARSRTAA